MSRNKRALIGILGFLTAGLIAWCTWPPPSGFPATDYIDAPLDHVASDVPLSLAPLSGAGAPGIVSVRREISNSHRSPAVAAEFLHCALVIEGLPLRLVRFDGLLDLESTLADWPTAILVLGQGSKELIEATKSSKYQHRFIYLHSSIAYQAKSGEGPLPKLVIIDLRSQLEFDEDKWQSIMDWLVRAGCAAPKSLPIIQSGVNDLKAVLSTMLAKISIRSMSKAKRGGACAWEHLTAGSYRLDYTGAPGVLVMPDPLVGSVGVLANGSKRIQSSDVNPNGRVSGLIDLRDFETQSFSSAVGLRGRIIGSLALPVEAKPATVILKRVWTQQGVTRVELLQTVFASATGNFSFSDVPYGEYILTGHAKVAEGANYFYKVQVALSVPILDLASVSLEGSTVQFVPILEGQVSEPWIDSMRISATISEKRVGGALVCGARVGEQCMIHGLSPGRYVATFTISGDREHRELLSLISSSAEFEVGEGNTLLKPRAQLRKGTVSSIRFAFGSNSPRDFLFVATDDNGRLKQLKARAVDGFVEVELPEGLSTGYACGWISIQSGERRWFEASLSDLSLTDVMSFTELASSKRRTLKVPNELTGKLFVSLGFVSRSHPGAQTHPPIDVVEIVAGSITFDAPEWAAEAVLERRHRLPIPIGD